jgi:hypothetical protein
MSRSSHSPNPHFVTAAAALIAACAVWPLPATAQQSGATSPSAASSPGTGNQRDSGNGNEGNVPVATRQAVDDEQRLLGGPGASFDPYSSDSASPKGQENELMSEQRMKIVSPSEFYRSGSPTGTAGAPDEVGGTSGGAGGTAGGFGGMQPSTGMSGGGTPSSDDPMYDSTGTRQNYDYGSDTSSSLYRDPYQSSPGTSAGQPYRMPW